MKLTLSRISFINILLTAFVFSLVIGIYTIKITQESYESRVEQIEERYLQKNKLLVKNEVERITKRLASVEKVHYADAEKELKTKVKFIHSLFRKDISHGFDAKKLTEHMRKELDLYKWDDNTAYFFVISEEGTILYHGTDKSLEGKNIEDFLDDTDGAMQYYYEMLGLDEYYGCYLWSKPNTGSEKRYCKYVYSKRLDPLGIYIAAGFYKDELEKKLKETFFSVLEKERFGENLYGYFWVHDMDNVMLMHPTVKELVGTNMRDFKSSDGQYIIPEMNRLVREHGAGYLNYVWNYPGSTFEDEKISYVHLYEKMQLVIGSGFYMTELKQILQDEKENVKSALYENLEKILKVLLFLVVFSLISAWYMAKRIQRIEEQRKEHLNMLEQYKMVLDKSAVVSRTNPKGIITYVNQSFSKISGYTREEVAGKPHNIVRHSQTPKQQFKELWQTIQKGESWHGLLKNRKKNGESYFNRTTIIPIRDAEGKIIEYISAATDVTELIENRSKLQNFFKSDSLTGLGNRVSLIDTLTENQRGVLALINIDRFKEINDTYGHVIGDATIKDLSSRLFHHFTQDKQYKLYRIQADEFAIYSHHDNVQHLSDEIQGFMKDAGKEPYKIEEYSFVLTYSAGLAEGDDNLLPYADIALSEAKKSKSRIKAFDSTMKNIEEFRNNILWVEKLHSAIQEERIVPYYQPIFNFQTGEIEKYECLMRLIENDGVIPPGEYLPIAKKTKLYPELTYKMVGKSINRFSMNTLEFSVNLSVEDLMNEELMIFLSDYAEQKGVLERMVLEIIESEEMEEYDEIAKTIMRFKEKGVKIAIDDFGSGYSNYDYLISLQADFIKIDGSIIKHILDDGRTRDVVKSIVDFAQKSNMKTIAEFVSSEKLFETVRELGVDFAQGYYIGKPAGDLLED